jgi:hypothetical protein
MPSRVPFGILLLACVGCQSPDGARQPTASAASQRAMERAQNIDAFLVSGPVFLEQKTWPELCKLAPRKSEQIVPSEAGSPVGVKTELHLLEFEGLTLSCVVGEDGWRLRSMTVTDPRWELRHGLTVGSQAARIPAALGQPPQIMEGPVEAFSGERGTVRFFIQRGCVTKVEFTRLF